MVDDPRKSALLTAIAEQEAQLARIESERESARMRLAELRAEAVTLGPHPASEAALLQAQARAPHTPAEKVVLFRELFRGRDDVFPRLWTNSKKNPHVEDTSRSMRLLPPPLSRCPSAR